VLSSTAAAWTAIVLCAITAALEGLCAGRNVRAFFQSLRFPPYSAPLWAWSIIGALYYVIFGFVVFRLLAAVASTPLSRATLALIALMMVGNALANLVIFRARNLHLSFVIGCVFAGLDLLLLACLLSLDRVASVALAPYLLYRIYAVWWGRALTKLNS
jgi:tryptophan-rich sensory protein